MCCLKGEMNTFMGEFPNAVLFPDWGSAFHFVILHKENKNHVYIF